MIHLQRASMLLERSRFSEAETELRQALAIDSQNADAHSLLALVLSAQEKHDEAIREARVGRSLAVDSPNSHYVLAHVLLETDQVDEAKLAIEEAIRGDPDNPRFYAVLGQIFLEKRDWQGALQAAEQGLRLNPHDIECTNLRALAMVQLGRKADASVVIRAALAREPESSLTHANQGWTYLHQNQPRQALVHFREALRLNPNYGWARQGMIEALKAHNPIYRLMLGYFLWMSRLSGQAQWGIILGGFFGGRIVVRALESDPHLAPILYPVIAVYIAFALMTWTAPVLFDLVLRLHRDGRLALTREKLIASNWVGSFIVAALMLFVAGTLLRGETREALYEAALKSLAMILPLAATFSSHKPKTRRLLAIYTAGLAIVAIAALILDLGGMTGDGGLVGWLRVLFVVGWIGFTWFANIVRARQ